VFSMFIGFLMVFLDFNIELGSGVIGLLPDFVGFIFIVKGLDELKGESPKFTVIRPYAVAMAAYCGLVYILDLIGLSRDMGFAATAIGILATLLSLYITYTIILGIEDIEGARGAELGGDQLMALWKPMAVIHVLSFIVPFVFPFLGAVCIIAAVVLTIAFLVYFRRTQKAYDALPPAGQDGAADPPAPQDGGAPHPDGDGGTQSAQQQQTTGL